MKPTRLVAILSIALLSFSAVSREGRAQTPPDIFEWTGLTALGQPQGFGQGDPITLTWGFMALGTPINDNVHIGFANANNNLQTRLNTLYGSQAVWQPHFQSVFDRWSSISGLSYQFEAADDGATISTNNFPNGAVGVRADIRIGGKSLDGNSGVLAYNYFPRNYGNAFPFFGGDMVIDTNDNYFANFANNSRRLRNVVAHEHGHGLGMEHVSAPGSNVLMEPTASTAFDGPQYHDILIAHRGYGDVNEKSNSGLGNDTSSLSTSLGSFSSGQSFSFGNDARDLPVAFSEVDFVSIDNNSDTDFYSFSILATAKVNIFLESLGLTYNIGPSGGPTGPFNAKNRSNLSLDLIATNGTSILASANSTGLGGNESIGFLLSNPGTYFIRVSGANNPDAILVDTQFYGLSLAVAVPEPGALTALGIFMLMGLTQIRHRNASLRR